MPNKKLMCDLRSVGLFCGDYHKKYQLHSGAIAWRWAVDHKEIKNRNLR
jgi:hypothetical protein